MLRIGKPADGIQEKYSQCLGCSNWSQSTAQPTPCLRTAGPGARVGPASLGWLHVRKAAILDHNGTLRNHLSELAR